MPWSWLLPHLPHAGDSGATRQATACAEEPSSAFGTAPGPVPRRSPEPAKRAGGPQEFWRTRPAAARIPLHQGAPSVPGASAARTRHPRRSRPSRRHSARRPVQKRQRRALPASRHAAPLAARPALASRRFCGRAFAPRHLLPHRAIRAHARRAARHRARPALPVHRAVPAMVPIPHRRRRPPAAPAGVPRNQRRFPRHRRAGTWPPVARRHPSARQEPALSPPVPVPRTQQFGPLALRCPSDHPYLADPRCRYPAALPPWRTRATPRP